MSNATGTRRRAGVLREAIREAVNAELAEEGYAGVTFEGVARRAQTSKPVLYRRYRSRAHMVVDSLAGRVLIDEPTGTTGSLREDLARVLTTLLARVRSIGLPTYRGVLGEADDELVDDMIALSSQFARETITRALDQARDRGEIGPRQIPERALMTPVALVRHELVIARVPLDDESITEILDEVFLPLVHTLSRRPGGVGH